MDSTMMDHPLSTQMIFERGERLFASSRIIGFDGATTTVTPYAQVAKRARRLASALSALGLRQGEVLGTYCWNTQAHLEAYLAVPAMGCVLHTLNVRLPAPHLEFVIGHADDRVLLVDAPLLEALAAVLPALPRVEHLIVNGPSPGNIAGFRGRVHDYEALIAGHEPMGAFPQLRESDAAAVCYTSGTTGLPKGVVYSHRSVFLHSLASMAADCFAISNRDRILMVPPMFHANAWGMPFSGWLAGSDMILPGRFLQPDNLARLIAAERPTLMAAVPTILNDLLQAHARAPIDLSSFRTIVSGGSAVSSTLIERVKAAWGVDVVQGWGMTETSPMCVLSFPPRDAKGADEVQWRAKSGRPVPGMHVRIVDDADQPLPEDGETTGHLQLKGPWVSGGYLREAPDAAPLTADGWLRTGDVGRIDELGFVQITDRAKDLIKSGGEWISSVELEIGIAALDGVIEAAVIAVPDPRWEERPLALVVLDQTTRPEPAALRAELLGRFARYMIPEYWAIVETLPRTSVGKIDKKQLREKFDGGDLSILVESRFGAGEGN
ncbi:MAG: long-chain fatty acid--CoA ligase [Alphaproteobacteria bacterium]|nr:long-chain fatty acid--CoA ligase [Alphaproteobacteria bacterium]